MRLLLATLGVGLLVAGKSSAEQVDYLRDVKPILAKHCYACHGPTKQRSALRLDTGASALKGGDSGPVIVPGKAGQSKLILAVAGAAVCEGKAANGRRVRPKEI